MLKIKKTNKYKKIVSIIFILITLLSTMQPIIFAVSSSGTGQWVSGQWDTQIFTTENNTSVGILLRRLLIAIILSMSFASIKPPLHSRGCFKFL